MKNTDKRKHSAKYINGVRKYIKSYKLILPAAFFSVMFIGMFVAMLFPLRPTFSEQEKRELAKFPSFSLTALFDGTFFKGIDTWYSDTFPMREHLIARGGKLTEMRGFGNRIYGLNDNIQETIPTPSNPIESPNDGASETTTEEKEPEIPDQIGEVTQSLSNIVVIGNAGYEYCSFNQPVADKYAKVVNKTASALKDKTRVYSMLVPTSIDIMISDNVRKGINTCDQSAAMDYIYGSLNSDAKAVNIFKTMRMHRDEYIYYRTDHHWTALGAYYAYRDYAQAAGFKPRELDKFEKASYGDFLGSFYSDTNNTEMKKNPDELIAYVPKYKTSLKYTDTQGRTIDWKLVNDVSNYGVSLKYSAFTAGDNPYTYIENQSKEKGKSCLVIKESFGNAIIPYIVGHYKKVYVVDYRYYKKGFISLAKEKNVSDIVFINNMSAVRSEKLIDRMNAIAQ
ncbi:MAG: DHHW family protein [Faecalibacterium sp.]|nr:DHHW family protein [Ruminococcus sp.]MCM1391403.1 DHHW family protein [Ruminococcus sp.]MCM1486628.1 DHHW family protein [Faecalibacterium sp.]